jgi:hypothetical protein
MDKVVSPRQLAANQKNALRSTGPRTPEGKAASSTNAVVHGLCARTAVIPGESQAALDRLREDLSRSWLPANERELFLFEEVVLASWRLVRLRNVETQMWSHYILNLRHSEGLEPVPSSEKEAHSALAGVLCESPEGTFRNYFRHERIITRDFYRATRELDRVQALHRRLNPSASPAAAPPEAESSGSAGGATTTSSQSTKHAPPSNATSPDGSPSAAPCRGATSAIATRTRKSPAAPSPANAAPPSIPNAPSSLATTAPPCAATHSLSENENGFVLYSPAEAA